MGPTEPNPLDNARVAVGIARRKGKRQFMCDASAARWYRDNRGILAVAVVDGIGDRADVENAAHLIAECAVRVGGKLGILPGFLHASALVSDDAADAPDPDAVMVLAISSPGVPTAVAHVGDCRAYAFDGVHWELLTADHTLGAAKRQSGASEIEAAKLDNVVTTTVARATPGTIAVTETDAYLLVLLSDGVHKRVAADEMASIVENYENDPQRCAHMLVRRAQENGATDNVTAIVMRERPRDLVPDPSSSTTTIQTERRGEGVE